jgi:hypothetical protein
MDYYLSMSNFNKKNYKITKWPILSKNYIEIMRMIFILKIVEIIESFIIQETKL